MLLKGWPCLNFNDKLSSQSEQQQQQPFQQIFQISPRFVAAGIGIRLTEKCKESSETESVNLCLKPFSVYLERI